jgi:DNA invertase Pin-like site-specific DNA recombinase
MVDCCAKKRGAIYARANRWKAENIAHQIKICREKMKADDVEEVHPPITDCGSGSDFQRAGLAEVLKLAKSGSFDRLYVSDVDRIGRGLLHLIGFLVKLRSHAITVVARSQVFDIKKLLELILIASAKALAAEEQIEIRRIRAIRSGFTRSAIAYGIPMFHSHTKRKESG